MSFNPDRVYINQIEHIVAGQHVLTNDENTRVRFERAPQEDGSNIYSVVGHLALERSAITTLSRSITHGYPRQGDWRPVRDGLRNISYPTKRIRAWSRTAEKAAHLQAVGPAARELADILTNNQDYRIQTANIPIFNFGESFQYAYDELLQQMSSRRVVNELKSLGVEPDTARRLSAFVANEIEPAEVVRELQEMLGLTNEELQEMENKALLEQVDIRIVTELAYRLHNQLFVGFPRQVEFDSQGLKGGGDDPAILIRERDVPSNIIVGQTNVAVASNGIMRDRDRHSGLERHRVTFYTQAPRYVALPRLVWKNQDGQRSFQFPKSEFMPGWQQAARPSSLVGAALAAHHFSESNDISYWSALAQYTDATRRRLVKSRRGQSWEEAYAFPGLFPLVLNHRQEEVLDDDYFTSIEEALE